jgi:hypothetical protein
MIKIITPGTTTYRVHCGNCACEFTYERGDVHHNYVRGGEWVACPTCGRSCAHFGEGGTSWAPRRRSAWHDPESNYQPYGPLPKGSCFGD